MYLRLADLIHELGARNSDGSLTEEGYRVWSRFRLQVSEDIDRILGDEDSALP